MRSDIENLMYLDSIDFPIAIKDVQEGEKRGSQSSPEASTPGVTSVSSADCDGAALFTTKSDMVFQGATKISNVGRNTGNVATSWVLKLLHRSPFVRRDLA